jgi:hypothetical protein
MQVVGVLLVILSVSLVAAPVGAVVILYRDDLTGLVVPPEIKGVLNGDGSFILNDDVKAIEGYSNDPNQILNNLVTPTFVDANVDENTKTFSVRVNVTNPLNYDLTLNTLSTDVQSIQGQTLASVDVAHPYTMVSGESTIIEVQGSWTGAGEVFITDHWYDQSITIALANIVVDVNGVRVERSEPLTVSLPVTLSGVLVG